MNRDLAISEESRWLVDPARLARGSGGGVDPRFGDPGRIDLAAIILLLLYRRWMVLGAGLAGLLLAVVSTMLTTPLYRASGTLEVNPPTIQIMDARNNVQSESGTTFDFVVTQVGLLSSRAIAERTAQDLNLAAIPAYGGSGSAAERLDHATGAVLGGIKVVAPESGTLIPYSYTSPSPQMAAAIANQLAASFINAGLQRRYDASSYARNFLSNQMKLLHTRIHFVRERPAIQCAYRRVVARFPCRRWRSCPSVLIDIGHAHARPNLPCVLGCSSRR